MTYKLTASMGNVTRVLSWKVMLSVVLFVVFGALALTEAGDDETVAMV